jgi:hypothetical protein
MPWVSIQKHFAVSIFVLKNKICKSKSNLVSQRIVFQYKSGHFLPREHDIYVQI